MVETAVLPSDDSEKLILEVFNSLLLRCDALADKRREELPAAWDAVTVLNSVGSRLEGSIRKLQGYLNSLDK